MMDTPKKVSNQDPSCLLFHHKYNQTCRKQPTKGQNKDGCLKQMSSSLKERLKRCGRYHASPKPLTPVSHQPNLHSSASCGTPKRPPAPRKDNAVTDVPSNESVVTTCGNKHKLSDRQTRGENVDTAIGTPVRKKLCTYMDTEVTARSENSENSPLGSLHSGHCDATDNNSVVEYQNRSSEAIGTSLQSSSFTNYRSLSKFKKCKVATVGGTGDVHEQLLDNSVASRTVEVIGCDGCGVETYAVDMREKQGESQEAYIKLSNTIKDKEEELRKLQMVKMYRSKNDLTELQHLIDRWRDVSQQALQDLHEAMPEPKPTITQLVNHLGIDHRLIGFDSEDESFS